MRLSCTKLCTYSITNSIINNIIIILNYMVILYLSYLYYIKQEAIFHGGSYSWLFMDHGYLHLLACIYSMIIVIYKFIDK